MSKTCVVWLCGDVCEESLKRFNYLKRDANKMGYDIIWAKDESSSQINQKDYTDIQFFTFDHYTLIKNYRCIFYLEKYNKPCFNTILVLLELYKTKKDYDYYWLIEEDVVMGNNNWMRLFEWSEGNIMDCLCTHFNLHAMTDSHYNDLYDFDTLEELAYNEGKPIHPMYSHMKYIWHSFLCIGRLSNKALDVILEYYKEYNGFFEYVVPSILRWHKLHVEDIGQEFYYVFGHDFNYGSVTWKKGNVSQWYKSESKLPFNDGMIFHPIKLNEKIIE